MKPIYQPDRILLTNQIRSYSDWLYGLVLNLGCGDYDRYGHLFKRVHRFVHMDISLTKLTTVVGDAHYLPFKDEVFDSILCTQVLEHLHDPQHAFSEMARVLKCEGVILITFPFINELHEEPFDYFRFTKYALHHLAEKVGFKVILVAQRGGFFATIAQLLTRYLIERTDAYRRPLANQLIRLVAGVVGRIGIFLDHLDKTHANGKFSLGWVAVLRKKSN